jgi:hypothetical protein
VEHLCRIPFLYSKNGQVLWHLGTFYGSYQLQSAVEWGVSNSKMGQCYGTFYGSYQLQRVVKWGVYNSTSLFNLSLTFGNME